jgi:hypothetical protein
VIRSYGGDPGRTTTVRLVAPKVELYWWEGCPSTPETLALLEDVLAERGVDAEVHVHEVRSDEEASQLAFPGSPTIRVDGRDVDPAGATARPALTCRIYRLPDGRVSPVPSREQLEEALR